MNSTSLLSLIASLAAVGSAAAATVSPVLLINFDGTLVGTTYTPASGELVTSGTFAANGTPTVGSGKAAIDGSVAVSASADGFKYSTTLGSLAGTNWVAEAIFAFDAFGTGQRTLIDVQGDTDFRVNNAGNGLQAIYWDGTVAGSANAALPTVGTYLHYALVWDAAATSLTAYLGGVSIGTVNNNAFATPDLTNISFGYLGRSGNVGRGVDGTLEAISFSTFTGSFNSTTDFLIPEPSVALLGLLGFLPFLRRRR